MWELNHKERWMPKNWYVWTVVLGKTLDSLLDCKEIKPVNPKGNWSWISIGRTDAEAEAPIVWSPDAKDWLTGRNPDIGEEKGMIEDEMVGWHHWLNRHEFAQALGGGDGQGSLACCSPWGHKELGMTEWTELMNTVARAFQKDFFEVHLKWSFIYLVILAIGSCEWRLLVPATLFFFFLYFY